MSDDEINPLDEMDIGDEDTDLGRGYARGFAEGRRQAAAEIRLQAASHQEWLDEGLVDHDAVEELDVVVNALEWAARIAEGNTAGDQEAR